ncbi:MAG: hypothetical protein ABI823_04265 [Bryobacteraceae bacterium]
MRFFWILVCSVGFGQTFEQRGFFETATTYFPQSATNDSAHLVNQTLFRWDASYRPFAWLKLSTVFDARFDSHRQFEREFRLDIADRRQLRPALSIRQLSATLHKGRWTAELGRQFIRWGKTDILNPTDRFAPKDFLSVINSDFLGVTAGRLTYERGNNTVDMVIQPIFTPSRGPLLYQRWGALPAGAESVPIIDEGARYPGGSQYGIRANHIGRGYEASMCFFEGYNHLPLYSYALTPTFNGGQLGVQVNFQRFFPKLRLYGGDFAMPLRWFTVKSEAAYFTTSTPQADEYLLYVVQLERTVKEWVFAGGYAGEAVTQRGTSTLNFAPDRGLTKAILGSASLTIDANRSISSELALRQNGAGIWARFSYSQLFGQHWRATAGLAVIRGDASDFLGQYRRNSYLSLALRYSF